MAVTVGKSDPLIDLLPVCLLKRQCKEAKYIHQCIRCQVPCISDAFLNMGQTGNLSSSFRSSYNLKNTH